MMFGCVLFCLVFSVETLVTSGSEVPSQKQIQIKAIEHRFQPSQSVKKSKKIPKSKMTKISRVEVESDRRIMKALELEKTHARVYSTFLSFEDESLKNLHFDWGALILGPRKRNFFLSRITHSQGHSQERSVFAIGINGEEKWVAKKAGAVLLTDSTGKVIVSHANNSQSINFLNEKGETFSTVNAIRGHAIGYGQDGHLAIGISDKTGDDIPGLLIFLTFEGEELWRIKTAMLA